MKILSLSLILTCLGLSTISAKPQCCIDKEACCLTKEKCCEDERKPHGRKPHGRKPHIDWEAKKAEFLKKFDKDGDGKISPEERKAIAEEWKKRIGEKPRGRKRPEGRKPRPDRKKRPAKKGGQ
jgi:hypothetical protein|tara:strand:- start:2113 stop:2484 length:372 start_codon:yes stop_codon:yes gene_type:complete